MKRFFLLILIAAALTFTACQSTPDEPVVMQKDLEQMIEQGMEQKSTASPEPAEEGMDYSELCAHYGVPERFQKDFTEQGVTIHADIAIELPEMTAIPMAHVEAARFSQEQVYALFNALCADTPMYVMPETLDKEHYQDIILEYQVQLAQATNEDAVYSLNSTINELTALYEEAPDSMNIVSTDGTLQTRDIQHEKTDAASGVETYLEATSDPYQMQYVHGPGMRSTATQLTVYNDVDYNNTELYSYVDEQGNTQNFAPSSSSSLVFQRNAGLCRYGLEGTRLQDVTKLMSTDDVVDGCLLSTTPLQAQELVKNLVAQTGMDDMVIDSVALYSSKEEAWPAEIYDSKIEMMEQIGIVTSYDLPETQAYVFRLLRQVNEVKVESDHDSSMTNMDGVSYGKEWMYEVLTIAVDDEGIANLYWTGPLNVTEILTEDTTIKPWSDIESVFEKMMPIMYTSYTDYYTDFRIDVTHASLSLQRIMEKDSFTTGLLVPVWNFYGTMTYTDDRGNDGEIDIEYCPLLSVNAIDGSVIDTDKGY